MIDSNFQPLFSTPRFSCYELNDCYNQLKQKLKEEGFVLRVIRVQVPGAVCGRHHSKIVGWRSDFGQVQHDDGYCSQKDRCFSTEGSLVEKRLLAFPKGTVIPDKHSELMKICRAEISNPFPNYSFNWI